MGCVLHCRILWQHFEGEIRKFAPAAKSTLCFHSNMLNTKPFFIAELFYRENYISVVKTAKAAYAGKDEK